MTHKTLAQTLVTVQTVRVANGRLMTQAPAAPSSPAPSTKVASKVRDVSSSGRFAMKHAAAAK